MSELCSAFVKIARAACSDFVKNANLGPMRISIKVVLLAIVAILPALTFAHSKFPIRKVNPARILPTQGFVGLAWVQVKIKRLSRFSEERLDRKLFEDPAPAVVGPDGRLWLVDGHHEFRALAEMKVRAAYVQVLQDFSGWDWDQFVGAMRERKWFYLGKKDGVQEFKLEELPNTVLDLEDYPHRSLTSFLRAEGGFKKSKDSHAEFQWSNALHFIDEGLIRRDSQLALALALEFSHSDRAAHLPGFVSCESRLLPTKKEKADRG